MPIAIASRLDRIQPSASSMAGQRARELRAAGRDIVGLTSGEPDFATPDHVIEAARRAMDRPIRYTDVGGTPDLKRSIQAKFRRDNGLDYGLDELIVGTGAKQVIFNAFMSSIEPGDEVIVPAPYWVSYPDIVRLAEGMPVFVDCPAKHGFRLQAEDLERAITPRTRWLVLNAPNNPSGAVYTEAQLKSLTDVLLQHPQVAVLTDDIYEHVLYDGRRFVTPAQVEPELKSRTLTINGVSKAYAMTGWRIGYAGGPAALIKAMTKLQSQSTSNPNSVAQAAAIAALDGPQQIVAERTAIFQDRRDHVLARLAAITGLQCHRPDGAFYLYPSCAAFIGRRTPDGRVIANDRDFVMHLLESENLAVLQGDAYGMSPFIRISFATAIETLDEGCMRLQRACEALQ